MECLSGVPDKVAMGGARRGSRIVPSMGLAHSRYRLLCRETERQQTDRRRRAVSPTMAGCSSTGGQDGARPEDGMSTRVAAHEKRGSIAPDSCGLAQTAQGTRECEREVSKDPGRSAPETGVFLHVRRPRLRPVYLRRCHTPSTKSPTPGRGLPKNRRIRSTERRAAATLVKTDPASLLVGVNGVGIRVTDTPEGFKSTKDAAEPLQRPACELALGAECPTCFPFQAASAVDVSLPDGLVDP